MPLPDQRPAGGTSETAGREISDKRIVAAIEVEQGFVPGDALIHSQPVYGLTALEFERLQKPSSTYDSLAGACAAFLVGHVLDKSEQLLPVLTGAKSWYLLPFGLRALLTAPTIAAVISFGIGRIAGGPRRRVLKSIRAHFDSNEGTLHAQRRSRDD